MSRRSELKGKLRTNKRKSTNFKSTSASIPHGSQRQERAQRSCRWPTIIPSFSTVAFLLSPWTAWFNWNWPINKRSMRRIKICFAAGTYQRSIIRMRRDVSLAATVSTMSAIKEKCSLYLAAKWAIGAAAMKSSAMIRSAAKWTFFDRASAATVSWSLAATALASSSTATIICMVAVRRTTQFCVRWSLSTLRIWTGKFTRCNRALK